MHHRAGPDVHGASGPALAVAVSAAESLAHSTRHRIGGGTSVSGDLVDVVASPDSRFEPMSPFEIAAGWVFGTIPLRQLHGVVSRKPAPRDVLDDVLVSALQRPPCFVLFSGGRDSSALLACAAQVARREGLAPPIPVTRVFPDDAAASEEEWQRQVIEHVGLADWVRIDVHDELDILGPLAQEGLLRHGVIHPATAYSQAFTLRALRGGRVLTGEGGDDVFGAQRITPLVGLVSRRRPVTRALLAAAAESLAPAAVRRYAAARRESGWRDWLKPAIRARAERVAAREAAAHPLSWADGVRHTLRHRGLAVGLRNLAAVAAENDVELVHPFLDQRFVDALAAWGGRFGPVGRGETMRQLFGELLPDDVLRRKTKATFNAAAVNRHSREFLRSWDGYGLDDDLVDTAVLRRRWAEPAPLPATLALLQQAWLSTQRPRRNT